MANIKSFPNNQDVYIGAEDVMKWLHGRTSGVFAADGNASVSALVNPTMAVTVSDGLGWMANAGKDGVVWWIDNEATSGSKLQLNIEQADGALNRIDRIIVEWKTTNYVDYPEVKVLKGDVSSKATAPALTNNSTVRQISLAKINVTAGTTAITASMITDERLDSSVCGLVTESISIDTSVMQNQFEALLTAIQTELQNLNAGTECLLKAGGTMYGVLDMGNNTIQNVATPKNETDAVNKQFVENALEQTMSMELLWQNDSPNSNFATRILNLNLSAYSFIRIVSNYSGTMHFVDDIENKVGVMFQRFYVGNDVSLGKIYREFEIRDDGVLIRDGYFGAKVDNSRMKPIRIYGIKGVF